LPPACRRRTIAMLDRFAVHQPASVAEASEMLGHFGADAAVYAGGTELLVVMKERLAHFPHLIDIKRISGLRDIRYDDARHALVIGATTRHRDLERSLLVRDRFPVLAAMAAAVANVRVRTAGTIGGNLCFAEPHSDPATLLTALEARLTLASTSGERDIPIADFITGLMTTTRRHEEILTAIAIPDPGNDTGVAYERFKIHERPTAAVAAVIAADDGVVREARIVAGSVGERPQRLLETEALLHGQPISASLALTAADRIRDEVETTGDAFESESYKRQLAREIGRRAIAAALPRSSGERGNRHAA
jgi:carbon-monoxide dehydrogenase medium subunit